MMLGRVLATSHASPDSAVPTTASCIEARTIPRTREAMMPDAMRAVERARLASGEAGSTGEAGAMGESGAKGETGWMGQTGGVFFGSLIERGVPRGRVAGAGGTA